MVSALPTAPTLRFSWGVLFRGLTAVRSRYDLSIWSPPVGADQVFTEPTGIFLGPRATIRPALFRGTTDPLGVSVN
jgi:hypothetical protein